MYAYMHIYIYLTRRPAATSNGPNGCILEATGGQPYDALFQVFF